MLRAEAVSKRFPEGVLALDQVSFEVPQGQTLALVGESGCGKTTLLRMFNRMIEPTEGRVLVGDQNAASLSAIELRRQTGYVQQEGGLLPHWDVARNVLLVPELLSWSRSKQESRVQELLDLVGLPHGQFASRYPHQLSGGQRQRVAFARALAADPKVILLDEPFGALDALTRLDLQKEFQRLKNSLGKTMMMVTHDLEEAFRLADLIAVMQSGRILQLDTPKILETKPKPGYVSDLLNLRGSWNT
ncbi:MAG: ATP-binding cassette domain-containing protein [Candidatus Eisenbacteria bacterium]|uniref:ATP-binding cassette domain-containing protein n=1 Tax=Eiseniibacteriota bacterium TaxID=2212470 RepID=A0A7Y2E7M6_UNCEI|nr:ATP-binding cassette domain-containing protein [Candidatus Eisenbacteria bacterium]